MIRDNYILFWGTFFAISAIGGAGVIVCLTLIVRHLKLLCAIMRNIDTFWAARRFDIEDGIKDMAKRFKEIGEKGCPLFKQDDLNK